MMATTIAQMIPSFNANSRLVAPLLLFVTVFCVYAITLSENYLGYEGETIEQARRLVEGVRPIEGRAGLLDVAFYVPFVALAREIGMQGSYPSFQVIFPNFALPLCMALVVLFVFLAACEIYDLHIALAVALIFAFTTMAWPYSKMGMETGITLASAVFLWGYVRLHVRRAASDWWIIALGLGAMLLTKVQAPFVIACSVALLAIDLYLKRIALPSRRSASYAGVLLAAAGALFVGANLVRYGRWFLSTSYSLQWEAAAPRNYLANLAGYWISPGKSMLIYSPSLLLALAAARRFSARHRWYPGLLLIWVVPQILLHAYFRTWADETWGPRRLMSLIPVVILPAGAWFADWSRQTPSRRALVMLLLVEGLAMQCLAVSMNYASYIQILQPLGLGTTHNLVWNRELAHYRFQATLLRSWARRKTKGRGLAVRFDPRDASAAPEDFHPWNMAPAPVPAIVFQTPVSLSPHDKYLNFWWTARMDHNPDRKLGSDPAFFFLFVFMVSAAGGVFGLTRLLRRERLLNEADLERRAD